MRSYLVAFGTSFVLIDSDARAVIDREKNWTPGKQNPAFDEDLLRCLAANWRISELSIAMLLDTVADQPALIASLQARHKKHKQELKAAFDEARNKYRTDLEWRHQLDNVIYSYTGSNAPTEYVYAQIVRECISTHEHFVPSDSLDFEHCVVPLAYCDYVVLDKKWARRCRKIDRPLRTAAVFSGVEVDRLVRDIKSLQQPDT